MKGEFIMNINSYQFKPLVPIGYIKQAEKPQENAENLEPYSNKKSLPRFDVSEISINKVFILMSF